MEIEAIIESVLRKMEEEKPKMKQVDNKKKLKDLKRKK